MLCCVLVVFFFGFWPTTTAMMLSTSLSSSSAIINNDENIEIHKSHGKKIFVVTIIFCFLCVLSLNLLAFITYIDRFAGFFVFFVNSGDFLWCYNGNAGSSWSSRSSCTIAICVCCIGYNYFVRIGYTTFGFFALCGTIKREIYMDGDIGS